MAVISYLKAVLSLDNKKFEKGLDDSKKKVKGFSGELEKVGGQIATALSVGAVAKFSFQMVDLQAKVKNVDRAFQTLNLNIKDLRASTGDMVADMDLKQQAIQAKNLGLEMANFGKLLEFATIRASQTGQEVDYLVQSVVLGIGRKSIPILDNLGLSATAIREEFAKTGDFVKAVSNIIDREMRVQGVSVKDVKNEASSLSAQWSNMIDNLAKATNKPQALGPHTYIAGLTMLLKKFNEAMDDTKEKIGEWQAPPWVQAVAGTWKPYAPAEGYKDAQPIIRGLKDEIDLLTESMENATSLDRIKALKIEIALLEKELQKITKPVTYGEAGKGSKISSMESLGPTGEEMPYAIGSELSKGITKMNEDLEANAKAFVKASMAGRQYAGFIISELDPALIEMSEIMETIVSTAIQNLAQTLIRIVEGENILVAFKDFIVSMGEMMATYGALLVAQGVAQKAFEGGEAVTKIIAGLALVALGLAVAGVGSAINTSGSSGTPNTGSGGGSGYGGNGGYDYNRDVTFTIRGTDLVAVLDNQNSQDYNNG